MVTAVNMVTPCFQICFDKSFNIFILCSLRDWKFYFSSKDVVKLINEDDFVEKHLSHITFSDLLLTGEDRHIPSYLPSTMGMIEEGKLLTCLSSFVRGNGLELYHFLKNGYIKEYPSSDGIGVLFRSQDSNDTLISEWLINFRRVENLVERIMKTA